MKNTLKKFFCSIISKGHETADAQDLEKRTLFNEKMRIIESRIHPLNKYNGEEYAPEQQIELLEFYKRTILRSVEADMLNTIVNREDGGVSGTVVMPEYKIVGEQRIDTNRKDITVLVAPVDQNKILGSIERESEFDPDKCSELTPTYFPELGIVSVGEGGRHSIAEAYVNREPCVIPVIVADTTDVWDKYTTDGSYWYNVENGEEKMVFDYRLAVVFQIQKMIKELKNK